jgi:hypothetical protein
MNIGAVGAGLGYHWHEDSRPGTPAESSLEFRVDNLKPDSEVKIMLQVTQVAWSRFLCQWPRLPVLERGLRRFRTSDLGFSMRTCQ